MSTVECGDTPAGADADASCDADRAFMVKSSIKPLSMEVGAHLQAMEKDLEILVRIESPTHCGADVCLAQDFLADRLRWAGAEVERHPVAGIGDHLIARWHNGGPSSRAQILIVGHVDTVYGLGEIERRPPRREGHQLWGPGTFDMKAGLIMG